MMDYFWVDEFRNTSKSYSDFVDDLNSLKSIKKYIKASSPYEVFVSLIGAILNEMDTVFLDADLSDSEVLRFGIAEEDLAQHSPVKDNKFDSIEKIIEPILNRKLNCTIELLTSGTTGKPKRVKHDLSSLLRMTKVGEKYDENVWGFAYNATHFAGIQVFFQAFVNRNPLINIFDYKNINISSTLTKYGITHISATPTYYRSVLPVMEKMDYKISNLTSGGEKFDSKLVDQFLKIFPGVKFHNVYASTEAGSILYSKGNAFKIPVEYKNQVRISELNELQIHSSLIGETASLEFIDGWYHTEDIVEFIDDTRFVFKNRKSEMINVGGYNVNPNEVEEIIRKNKNVIDVHVKCRKNSVTGNIIVADIVCSQEVDKETFPGQLIREVSSHLQEWKVPRIIKIKKALEITRTGKLKRV